MKRLLSAVSAIAIAATSLLSAQPAKAELLVVGTTAEGVTVVVNDEIHEINQDGTNVKVFEYFLVSADEKVDRRVGVTGCARGGAFAALDDEGHRYDAYDLEMVTFVCNSTIKPLTTGTGI